MAEVTRYSCNGYWRDRMGYKRNAVSLSGVGDFAKAKAFLIAMQNYSNLALMRASHSAVTAERITGNTPVTGHFDLASYVARMSFYNYAAEDAGDSPNTTLVIAGPKDDFIVESKDGIWLVDETKGIEIANQMATALGLTEGDIEFIRGEVPEN